MPANAVVRARIDEKTKKKATVVLKSIGLTPSSAFRLMMTRIAKERQMPFDVHVPNAETIAAIEEGRAGAGLKTFKTVEALMAGPQCGRVGPTSRFRNGITNAFWAESIRHQAQSSGSFQMSVRCFSRTRFCRSAIETTRHNGEYQDCRECP